MATEEKKPPEAPTPTRNIIIGVTTTVLVTVVVYFLGFSKPKSGPTKLEVEKATVDAWTTYITIENNYTKNGALLIRDIAKVGGYKGLFIESKKESEKFREKIQKLSEAETVDKDLISMLKRRVKNEETLLPPTEKFYYEMDSIVQSAYTTQLTQKQVEDQLIACQLKYKDQLEGMINRALTELEDICKTLSERYHQPFNPEDFYFIQVYKNHKDILTILQENKNKVPITRENLIGKWDVVGATVMVYADGKWSWTVPVDSSSSEGTWELKNDRFILNVEKNSKSAKTGSWTFEIVDVTQTSMILRLTVPPNSVYTFVKK